MWMLPLYLHVNQKSDDDDDEQRDGSQKQFKYVIAHLDNRTSNTSILGHIQAFVDRNDFSLC